MVKEPRSMVLGERLATRDNNLNLIRALAATAVLVSHAWPISRGGGTDEPLERLIGHSLGHVAVLAFFAASGFLITASFLSRRSLWSFVAARVARLVPALAVSLLIVAFILGPVVTTLPLRSYITDGGVWAFLVRNLTLVFPQYTLPGVFATNPYPAIEGSIWTLVHEVACYVGVVVAGLLGLLSRRAVGTAALMAWLAVTVALPAAEATIHPRIASFLVLSQPFAFGMLACLWRTRLPVSALLAAALSATAFMAAATPFGDVLLALALAHLTLTLAVLPIGPLAAYARAGDYSYGLYIYAFPVQGLVVWLWGGPMEPVVNIALALPLTLLFAIPSWHLVERPALRRLRARSVAPIDPSALRAAPSRP